MLVVGRVCLHDEDVGAANRFAEAAVDLAVRELRDVGFAEMHVELVRDLEGERARQATGDQVQVLARHYFHACPRSRAPTCALHAV